MEPEFEPEICIFRLFLFTRKFLGVSGSFHRNFVCKYQLQKGTFGPQEEKKAKKAFHRN